MIAPATHDLYVRNCTARKRLMRRPTLHRSIVNVDVWNAEMILVSAVLDPPSRSQRSKKQRGHQPIIILDWFISSFPCFQTYRIAIMVFIFNPQHRSSNPQRPQFSARFQQSSFRGGVSQFHQGFQQVGQGFPQVQQRWTGRGWVNIPVPVVRPAPAYLSIGMDSGWGSFQWAKGTAPAVRYC